MKLKIFLALLFILAVPMSSQAALYHPDKSQDENLQALINSSVKKFSVEKFHDEETGLDLQYNLFLPEDYSTEKKFPVIFFIADGSSAGKEPEFSLTQGYGALVWTEYNAIVIVPAYPETVLDDHNGFVMSDYVELTARFVKEVEKIYSIDSNRVYATGQSMGCMTFLVLAAKYPDLFTACLFVSGQWDITKLTGLKDVKFIYATSAGDDKASTGQSEVIKMFDDFGTPYAAYKNIDAKNPEIFIAPSQKKSFITFKAGTTLPSSADNAEKYSEHMTSFDFVYKIRTVREWLFKQNKGE